MNLNDYQDLWLKRHSYGIFSGFAPLDKVTGSFQKGELIVLAGYPGSGKTTFALNITHMNSVDYERYVVYFSSDTSAIKTTKMFEQYYTQTPYAQRSKDNTIKYLHLIMMDSFNKKKFTEICTSVEKESSARMMMMVDYFKLETINRDVLLSDINFLKNAAISFNIPILVVLNLMGNDKNSSSQIPQLNDLGEIANLADIVLSIHKTTGTGELESDKLSIITILKNPLEELDAIPLRFNYDTSLLSNIDSFAEPS